MKKVIFFGMIISLIIGCCTQQKSNFPQGTWQLVSITHKSGDNLVSIFPGEYTGSDIATFSEHYFLSIGHFKKDTTIMNNYVGANYNLYGNHYEETLLYFPYPNKVGQKVKQLLELRNDTLIKTYPCDDNWDLSKNGYYIERYVRLK